MTVTTIMKMTTKTMKKSPKAFCGVTSIAVALLVVAMAQAAYVSAQVGDDTVVMNPNLAGAAELAGLPHMTAEIADGVIQRRPFLDMIGLNTYLRDVLSDDQRSELYVRLFVPVNLNIASREEILLVPGVGDRMAHEFEEYRPYRALPQFRREIGKYVDDDEVARFERYVFVPIDLNTAGDEDILRIPGVGARMLHEFKEYRPYMAIEQFRREIGKYVDDDEVARLERYVVVRSE
jgi:DNA uptake protein ComE-like DNA-binding protein